VGYVGNVENFLQNAWPAAGMLTPLWSLQVEEQFYWSFPLIVWMVSRKTLSRILWCSTAVALLLRIALVLAMPANIVGTYVLMPCRMDALAMGGLIAIARRDSAPWLKSRWIAWLTPVCGLAFVTVCLIYWEGPWSNAMRTVGFTAADLAFSGVLVLLLTARWPLFVSFCRLRFLVWVGTISYGLYLLQLPAWMLADRWVRPWFRVAPHGTTQMFLALAAATGLASAAWLGFESQVLKLKKHFTVS
jgi:peptidoglycan/LPS O-acetylase OafA/YrhL